MISVRKPKYLINSITFSESDGSPAEFTIMDLRNLDVMKCTLGKIKNWKAHKAKIKELRTYAESLNYYCYEPITVSVEHNGKIFSGSVCMKDSQDNLDYIEELAKDKGLV